MFTFYVVKQNHEGKTFAETKHSKLLASGISCTESDLIIWNFDHKTVRVMMER